MKVELRSFKHYPRLSEETTAFIAKVYIDGKLAGEASNRGHGEPVLVIWWERDLRDRFHDYLKTLPPVTSEIDGKPFTYQVNEDNFISDLVEKHCLCAELKKLAKGGKTVFRLKTDKPGEWFQTKQTPTEVCQRFGDKIDVIANHNFEKAAGLE